MSKQFEKLFESYMSLYEQDAVTPPPQQPVEQTPDPTQAVQTPPDQPPVEQPPQKIANTGLINIVNYMIGALKVDNFKTSHKLEVERMLKNSSVEQIGRFLSKYVFDRTINGAIQNCNGGGNKTNSEFIPLDVEEQYFKDVKALIPEVLCKSPLEDNSYDEMEYIGRDVDVTQDEIAKIIGKMKSYFPVTQTANDEDPVGYIN